MPAGERKNGNDPSNLEVDLRVDLNINYIASLHRAHQAQRMLDTQPFYLAFESIAPSRDSLFTDNLPHADDEIGRITTSLSAKWDLRFPPPVARSPATINQERPEEKVLARLRYLFFYDRKNSRAATKYAIDCFEQFAPKLLAGWVEKPRAEVDVLPTRTRSATIRQQGFLSTKPTLNDEQAHDLMQRLLGYLDETISAIRKGAIFSVEEPPQVKEVVSSLIHETLQSRIRQPLRRSSRASTEKSSRKTPSPLKDGDIKAYLKQTTNDPAPLLDFHAPKPQLPSSDDYKIDDELFDDVEMQDAPAIAGLRDPSIAIGQVASRVLGSFGSAESCEDRYQTPPDSPSKMYIDSQKTRRIHKTKSWSPKKPPTHGNESYVLPTDPDVQTRKRSFPEVQRPEMPRRVSRDNSDHRFVGPEQPQPVATTRYVGDAEFNRAQSRNKRNMRSFQKSFSAGSLTSVSSSSTSMTTSAWTTPNTSFRTETPATSFSSSQEPFELDDLGRESLHGRRSWQNLKGPFGLGLGMDLNPAIYDTAEIVPMGPPAFIPNKKSPNISVRQLLSVASPFVAASPRSEIAVHLRQLYELCRVSAHTKIPIQQFAPCLEQVYDDYESLWSVLSTKARQHGVAVPERSSLAAWKQSEQEFRGVVLAGSLIFTDQPGDQIFDFKLNPLSIDRSHRLSRKFGSDRFFVLGIPSIEPKNLPSHLRSDPDARKAIIDWIISSEHTFLGRKWRAFYAKPETRGKPGLNSRAALHSLKYRVYFFAESGYDFQSGVVSGEKDPRKSRHLPMTRNNMIEWLMPFKENKEQRALKFFARLAIGVSRTIPTIRFQPPHVIRSNDARADAPAIRRLKHRRLDERKGGTKPVKSQAAVMNDGCARISKAAAITITELLHLDSIPSVFQGRIAGAKGIWMVDSLDEKIGGPNGEDWIEITDSQLKLEANVVDKLYPDQERVTFEVLDFSRPLATANLNFQLMPILAERKVPFEVFRNLLEADLTARVAELEVAMESGLAIRKWNQEVNPVSTTRDAHGVSMHGGIPATTSEKINWFVEHGFEPSSCCRLKDILYSAISAYCFRLENRMNIGVAKSTYAYMIADPLAILEKGEVHLSFSSPFENETMLHNIDLLVARLPAALPSDIQKVRAVYRLELRSYRDVIVFSAKGTRPLAEKLSGGDYDGDKAWVCWEPDIVVPFENASVPETPPLKTYDIVPDQLTVKDLLAHDDYIDRFLHHAFSFTLRDSLLGICTTYFESLCYARNKIAHPSAVKVAHLLGLLVDSAKAGIEFTHEDWDAFLAKERLPKGFPKPAYKDKEHGVPTNPTHIIDRLVFVVAKGVREKALGDFSRKFKNVGTYDTDLVQVYKHEQEEAKVDKGIAQALKDLKLDMNKLRDYWAANCALRIDDLPDEGDPMTVSFGSRTAVGKEKGRRKSTPPFAAIAEHVRDRFLEIEPSAEAVALSPVVARWARDCALILPTIANNITSLRAAPTSSLPPSHWLLLKASFAFSLFHTTSFLWYAAGPELGLLKAQAKGCRPVITDIWQCMKIDGRAVDRRKGREVREAEGGMYELGDPGDEEVDGTQESEYGDWTWLEGVEIE
ncbi:MAG: hypothetical protein Q9218_002929 [Villophora microphyllina]